MAWLGLRLILEEWLGRAGASRFNEEDLRLLWDGGYATLEDLKDARDVGLQRAGLRPARADQIIRAQASAAGLRVESATGAGGASLTSPISRIGMTGLVTAGAFLMLFKAVVQAVCSIEAEPGCPAWVISSAALGDVPLSKVLLYGGVWAYLGAHQLAALAALRLREQFYAIGQQWPYENIVPGKPPSPPGCEAYLERQKAKEAKRAARAKQVAEAMANMPKTVADYKASRRLDWSEVSALDRLLMTPGQIREKYVKRRLMKQG